MLEANEKIESFSKEIDDVTKEPHGNFRTEKQDIQN